MINILTPLNILPLSRRPHSNDSFSPSTKSLSLITVNWIESRTSVTGNNTRSSSLYSKKNIQIGIHECSRIIPMNKFTQFRLIGWDTIIITMGYIDHNLKITITDSIPAKIKFELLKIVESHYYILTNVNISQ